MIATSMALIAAVVAVSRRVARGRRAAGIPPAPEGARALEAARTFEAARVREAAPAPTPASEPRVRLLEAADAPRAASLAHAAFRGNRFYESSMGLDERTFAIFWREFLALALADRRCRVYGIEAAGALQGLVVITFRGFPAPARGARYLVRLLPRLGLHRALRYLRFVHAYDRAMRRPRAEEEREGRAYWLLVAADAPVRGLGSRLVRGAGTLLHWEGLELLTGFVDGSNAPLHLFYRRLGFSVGPAFDFFGAPACRIEIPSRRLVRREP